MIISDATSEPHTAIVPTMEVATSDVIHDLAVILYALTVPLAVIVARCSHARGVQRNQYKTIRKVPSRSRSNAKKMQSSSMRRSAGYHLYVQSFDANFAPSEKVDGGRIPLLKYGANGIVGAARGTGYVRRCMRHLLRILTASPNGIYTTFLWYIPLFDYFCCGFDFPGTRIPVNLTH